MKLSSAINCHLSFMLIGCQLVGPELVSFTTLASAAELEPARRHSLIHRQEPVSPTVAPGDSAPTSPPRAAPTPQPLRRKLTKRPRLATVTTPANSSSQVGITVPQSPSALPTAPASSNQYISSAGATISSQAPAPATTAAPLPQALTGSSGTTIPLAGATLSTATPSPSSAFVNAGTGGVTSSGSSATSGRGMQSLTGQMPGLTQLLAPAVSISSPSPSTSPSSPSTLLSSSPPSASPPSPETGTATLSWTLSSESDLAGYKIYIGTAPGLYDYPASPITIGPVNSYTIAGLPHGQTYYFAVSAYNNSGGESVLSAEVSKSIY